MKEITGHEQHTASIEKDFDHFYSSILRTLRELKEKDHDMRWRIFRDNVNYEEFIDNLYEVFIRYFHGIQWYGEKNTEKIQKEILKSAVENAVRFISLDKVTFLYGIKKSYIALEFQNRYADLLEEIKKMPIQEHSDQESLRYAWFKIHKRHDPFIMDLIIGYNKDALYEIQREKSYNKTLATGLFWVDSFQYKKQNKFEGKIDTELLLVSIKYCIDHYTGKDRQGNPQFFLTNVFLNYNQNVKRTINNMGRGISKENARIIKASILLAEKNRENFENGIPNNLEKYLKEVNGNLTEKKSKHLIRLAYYINLDSSKKTDEPDETPSFYEQTGEIDQGFENLESDMDFQFFIKGLIQDWDIIELLEKKKQREWTKIGLTRDILKILKPLGGIPVEYFQKQIGQQYSWVNINKLLEANNFSGDTPSEADIKDALISELDENAEGKDTLQKCRKTYNNHEEVLRLFEQIRRPEGNEDTYMILEPYSEGLINNIFYKPYIEAAIDDDIYRDSFDCIKSNNPSKKNDNCKLRNSCPLGKPCERKSLKAIYCNPYRREFDFTYATIASILKRTETCLGSTESAVKTAFVKYKQIRTELFTMYGLKE